MSLIHSISDTERSFARIRFLFVLIVAIAVLTVTSPPSLGDILNFTLTDGTQVSFQDGHLPPSSVASGSISTLGRGEGGIYVIDETSARLKRTTLSIKANADDFDGRSIDIKEYIGALTGASHLYPKEIKSLRLPEGDVFMGVFVAIDITSDDIEWATLTVKYDYDDFPADIAEESIHLAGYDPDADEWVRLKDAPGWAQATGVDTQNGYAWANVSKFGIFGLMGGGMMPSDSFERNALREFLSAWKLIISAAVLLLTMSLLAKALRR